MKNRPNNPTKILIGKIGRPHGIKGAVKVNSYTVPIKNILNYTPWYFKNDNDYHETPTIINYKAGNHIIVFFEHYNTPENVRELVNKEIWINRSQLPELACGEYYWSDLIGLAVYNKNNDFLGNITELITVNHQDIMIINHTILIPYSPEKYILKIDLDKNLMQVDWHED